MPDEKVEKFVWSRPRYYIKARQSEGRGSVAAKLEQYTCTCLNNYLTFSWFSQAIVKLLNDFLVLVFTVIIS